MRLIVLAAVPLVLGAGGRPPDRLQALVAELGRTPDAGRHCFEDVGSLRGATDVRDLLPLQVPSEAETSDAQQLLAAVLPEVFGGETPIQHTAASSGEPSAMSMQGRPFATARVLFVATPADATLPHAARVRAIALTPEALEEYVRKFGETYPLALPLVAVDEEHGRALVRYDFMWRGGTLKATRKDGVWTVSSASEWIS